jgi:hypothetical protein
MEGLLDNAFPEDAVYHWLDGKKWFGGQWHEPYRCVVADPPWTPLLGATWNTRFTDKSRPQKQYALRLNGQLGCTREPGEHVSML